MKMQGERERKTENGERRTENRERRTEGGRQFSVLRSLLSVFCSPFSVLRFLLPLLLLTSSTFAQAPKSDWSFYQTHGHRSPKWDSLVEAGFDTFEGENIETAVNFLKRATALGCKDGLVFYKLALVVESGGNLKGTLEMLEKAAPLLKQQYKDHPATKELAEHLGKIYYQLERYDEALQKFLEAIAGEGENFLRTYLAGQIYRMQEKPKEAITYFEKALAYPPPREAPAMKQLARLELLKLFYDGNEFDKALSIVGEILKENPSDPTANSYRDQIRRKRLHEEEKKSWERMLNR